MCHSWLCSHQRLYCSLLNAACLVCGQGKRYLANVMKVECVNNFLTLSYISCAVNANGAPSMCMAHLFHQPQSACAAGGHNSALPRIANNPPKQNLQASHFSWQQPRCLRSWGLVSYQAELLAFCKQCSQIAHQVRQLLTWSGEKVGHSNLSSYMLLLCLSVKHCRVERALLCACLASMVGAIVGDT